MTDRLRLFAEFNGLLIPIHIYDEAEVMKSLRIQLLGNGAVAQNGEKLSEASNVKVADFRKVTLDDIINYITLNLGNAHSNLSIAQHFGLDIGKGNYKNKTTEQNHAYDKIYRFSGQARDIIAVNQNGKWIKGGAGVKNQIATWKFRKNEAGSQITR